MTIEGIDKLIIKLIRVSTQAADLAIRSAQLDGCREHSAHQEFDKILVSQRSCHAELIEAIKQYKEQK